MQDLQSPVLLKAGNHKLAATFLLIIFFSANQVLFAQSAPDSTFETKTSHYLFPTLFFTPETSLGGGGAYGFFTGLKGERPSSVQLDVSATLKGQYGLNIRPDIYRLNGRQRISGELGINYFPDLFYGIGPQTPDDFEEEFTSRYVETIVQLEEEIATNI